MAKLARCLPMGNHFVRTGIFFTRRIKSTGVKKFQTHQRNLDTKPALTIFAHPTYIFKRE
jgi:hypothetical protein